MEELSDRPAGGRSVKARNLLLWALQALLAIVFSAAGFVKLSGDPSMVEVFERIGAGQWFRLATGLIEISAAILLLIPRTTTLAAFLLMITMAGAIFTHFFIIGGSSAAPTAFFIISAFIFWGRFARASAKLK